MFAFYMLCGVNKQPFFDAHACSDMNFRLLSMLYMKNKKEFQAVFCEA